MTRETVLHILHHGSVKMQVVYISCESCSQIVRFDGEHDGLFAPLKIDVFTRELLDRWTYEVCEKGSEIVSAIGLREHLVLLQKQTG